MPGRERRARRGIGAVLGLAGQQDNRNNRGLSPIIRIRNVIEGAGIFKAEWTSHGERLNPENSDVKT